MYKFELKVLVLCILGTCMNRVKHPLHPLSILLLRISSYLLYAGIPNPVSAFIIWYNNLATLLFLTSRQPRVIWNPGDIMPF